jgi:hypothetical protein
MRVRVINPRSFTLEMSVLSASGLKNINLNSPYSTTEAIITEVSDLQLPNYREVTFQYTGRYEFDYKEDFFQRLLKKIKADSPEDAICKQISVLFQSENPQGISLENSLKQLNSMITSIKPLECQKPPEYRTISVSSTRKLTQAYYEKVFIENLLPLIKADSPEDAKGKSVCLLFEFGVLRYVLDPSKPPTLVL